MFDLARCSKMQCLQAPQVAWESLRELRSLLEAWLHSAGKVEDRPSTIEEGPMKPRDRRQKAERQTELFATVPKSPTWSELPPEVQKAAMELLSRVLRRCSRPLRKPREVERE